MRRSSVVHPGPSQPHSTRAFLGPVDVLFHNTRNQGRKLKGEKYILSLKYSIRCFQQMLSEGHSTLDYSYSKVPT